MKPGISDHERVVFEVITSINHKKCQSKHVYCFNEENINRLKDVLYCSYQNVFFNENNIEGTWNTWKTILFDCINKFVPVKKIDNKKSLPWVNRTLKQMLRKQNRLHAQCKNNVKKYNCKYKQFRTKVNNEMAKAKRLYVSYLCDNINGKPKKFWKFVKSCTKGNNGIAVLKDKFNKLVIDDDEKAEVLNREFASVITVDNSECKNPCVNGMYQEMLSDLVVRESQVYKLLKSLDISKATGPDNISGKMLKECAREIAPSLCKVFNVSLTLGCLPKDWRIANVTPIFKKGSHNDAANYRPVSITSLVCKILEKIIYDHIINFLDTHGILLDNQHGFRKQRSCETQLLSAINDWSESLENRTPLDIIYLDFSRAFDSVPHKKLLYKLKKYGICNNVFNWLRSFLTKREQRVVVNGKYSSWSSVTSGVPQGTILGPLMFLIFINDICNNIDSTCRLYADDCIIYRPIRNINDVVSLQMDLNRLYKWSEKWLLKFNVKKCKVMHISKNCNSLKMNYHIGKKQLEVTNCEQYLGIFISDDLSWKKHIQSIVSSSFQKLGLVNRVFYHCSPDIKEKLYNHLVRSKLEYCCTVWDPHQIGLISLLEKVQKKGAHIVLGSNFETYEKALSDLKWSTLYHRREYHRNVMCYKIYNNLVDIPFYTYFNVRNVRELRNVNTHHLEPKFARTDTCKYSFFYNTVESWNRLPANVISQMTLESFKNKLAEFYVNLLNKNMNNL